MVEYLERYYYYYYYYYDRDYYYDPARDHPSRRGARPAAAAPLSRAAHRAVDRQLLPYHRARL